LVMNMKQLGHFTDGKHRSTISFCKKLDNNCVNEFTKLRISFITFFVNYFDIIDVIIYRKVKTINPRFNKN
jgi:hypothetical protein